MAGTASRWGDPQAWGLAFWGAVVAVLGFPPGPVWPLALVAPAPLWALCLDVPVRDGFARGWFYGLGFFCGLLCWITPTVVLYGGLSYPAGVACLVTLGAYLALFPAVGSAALAIISRRSVSAALAVAPFVWVATEGVRGTVLTGFPWGDLPQALWRFDAALALAPWIGIDGVRLLVAGLSSGVAWLLAWFGLGHRPRRWSALPCALTVVGWAILLLIPLALPPQIGELNVAVVQGNIDQAQKWDVAFRASTLDIYSDLSRRVTQGTGAGRTDLILWPETAVPIQAQDPGPERERVEAIARESGAYVAFGAPAYEQGSRGVEYRNAVFLMNPVGELVGRYDKVHLVPFGEYVPFGRYVPFVRRLVQAAGDFTAGKALRPVDAGSRLPVLGPLVCFEVIFPDLAAQHARRGAQVLIVVTNDGWFGRSSGPYQHLAFAAWRAAELGLPLVRAANTGVSAVFDARGRLRRTTALSARDAFAARVAFRSPYQTPQHAVRRWIVPGCLVLAVSPLFAMLRAPPKRGTGNHLP